MGAQYNKMKQYHRRLWHGGK